MANCYFAKPHGVQHCYIPFFMLLISNALLVLARHKRLPVFRLSCAGQQGKCIDEICD
jgi:hypothetical protein